MSVEAQTTASTELPQDRPSSWAEYHNCENALAALRTLRADDDVECQCSDCIFGGRELSLDEESLDSGELEKTRDYLKDTTAHEAPIGKRSVLKHKKYQTEWRKKDVSPTVGIDRAQWRSMWLFQTNAMGEAPVEGRGASDEESARETADKLTITEIISKQLGCTQPQREEAESVMKKINVGSLGAHSDNRKAAIAALSLVTREDRAYGEMALSDRMERMNLHHNPTLIENDSRFEDVCKQFGFDPSFLSATRDSIKEQL